MNILTATIVIEVASILVFGWDLVRDAHRAVKRAKALIDRTNKILAQYR